MLTSFSVMGANPYRSIAKNTAFGKNEAETGHLNNSQHEVKSTESAVSPEKQTSSTGEPTNLEQWIAQNPGRSILNAPPTLTWKETPHLTPRHTPESHAH